MESRTAAALPDTHAATPVGEPANLPSGLAGTFPIGIDPSGRMVLLFLARNPSTDDFRTFLIGHTALLSVMPTWTLRLVFPQSLRRTVVAYQTVVHEELESRLDADTIRELQHYFFHRRRGTDVTALPETLRAILTRYSEAYGGPRFTHLYRRWLTDEQADLTLALPAIQMALAAGSAVVDWVVLPHVYDHLFPLVARRLSRRRRNTADAEEGDETAHGINPSLNPVP